MGIVSAENAAVCQDLGSADLGFFLTAVKDEQYEFSLHPEPWDADAQLVIAVKNDEGGGSQMVAALACGVDEEGAPVLVGEPWMRRVAGNTAATILDAKEHVFQFVVKLMEAPPGEYAVVFPMTEMNEHGSPQPPPVWD